MVFTMMLILAMHVISDKDFKRIEDKMIEIARGKHDFSIKSVSKADALSKYKKEENSYKVELN